MASPSKTSLSLSILVMSAGIFYSWSAHSLHRHFLSMSLIGSSEGLTMASPSKTSLSLSILVMSAGLFYSWSAHYTSLANTEKKILSFSHMHKP